jgi:hypothetical protein
MKINMCFLMDCTGSMERWIQAAKDHVTTMVQDIQHEYPAAEFETAFVGYRDYDDEEQFVVVGLSNPSNMLERIADVHAGGGDDTAEDVAGGLQRVCAINWDPNADMRVVIHIADAPPHGRMFHSPRLSDRFPAGDPEGLDPINYLTQLMVQNIGYTFVRINDTTDIMLDMFGAAWSGPAEFKVIDLTPQMFGGDVGIVLSRAVSDSITTSLSRHSASQDPAVM